MYCQFDTFCEAFTPSALFCGFLSISLRFLLDVPQNVGRRGNRLTILRQKKINLPDFFCLLSRRRQF